MRRVLISAAILAAVGVFIVIAGGASNGSPAGTYKVELDNAFGLVTGADFKVAGVKAGSIKSIGLCATDRHSGCQNPLHALVTVQVTSNGFGQFRSDAFCQSRPQSLIGEYFLECQPGQYGHLLKKGTTIPVTRTQSTIPADLLNDVMRLPYRQRFTLIINELGAAVAARSDDLKAALQRAVPALTETDNLLNLLANDSNTLQQLTVNSDQVITALANNSDKIKRFIDEANKAASATATQDTALQATWAKLPGFLEQLKPTMAKLGTAVDANLPVLVNLRASAGQLTRLFTDIPPFSRASLPALQSLGKASNTGRVAIKAAGPTITDLNQFAKPTPELAQNLSIVLRDLDDRSRAVEPDSRSPGGRGYTGLEALLQYVFNQTLAINAFSQFGHLLAVDAFADQRCSQYATPQRIADNLKKYGPSYRDCYAWLGPNQPGINETDPSNPGACVPDPGGAPPGYRGPRTSACKLQPSAGAGPSGPSGSPASGTGRGKSSGSNPTSGLPLPKIGGKNSTSGGGLTGAIGSILSSLGGNGTTASVPSTTVSTPTQAQQLLKYLLAP